jgi:hypothetical protein
MDQDECTGRTSGFFPSGHLIPFLFILLDARYRLESRAVTFWVFYESTRDPSEFV